MLFGTLTAADAIASLRASNELPEDWVAFSTDGRTVVCARMTMTSDGAPVGQVTSVLVAAITFDCADTRANVVLNGRAVPSRCVCDKSSSAERCVCVGGTIAELESAAASS